MSFIDTMLSASSGPIWGVIGVGITAGTSWLMNRNKRADDNSAAALGAINTGHKQLVEGLFQNVKLLTEEVGRIRNHADECDRQHRDAVTRLNALEAAQENSAP